MSIELPGLPLPHELVKSIFSHIEDDNQLVRIRRVCLGWRDFITSEYERLTLAACLAEARVKLFFEIPLHQKEGGLDVMGLPQPDWQRVSFQAHLGCAGIDPQPDLIGRLKEMAKKMHHLDLVDVILLIAKQDLEAGRRSASSIADRYYRAKALTLIAEIDPLHDFAPAITEANQIRVEDDRGRALTDIACQEAKFDVEAAKEVALLIRTEAVRIGTLVQIVEVGTAHNLKAIKKIAEEISEPLSLFSAQCAIASVDKSYLPAAKETLQRIGNTPRMRDYSRGRYAEIEALFDLKAAKETAWTISTLDILDVTLRSLVQIEARSNIAAAKETAKKIRDPNRQSAALKMIIQEEVKTDIEEAKKTVETMPPGMDQEQARLVIVKEQARTDLRAAQEFALSIVTPRYVNDACLEIVKADPEHNFSMLKARLKSPYYSPDGQEFVDFFLKLVQAEAEFHPAGARKTAKTVLKEELQACALIEVAKVIHARAQPMKK